MKRQTYQPIIRPGSVGSWKKTVTSFIQFVHVLSGITFFGLMLVSFMYVMNSIKQNDLPLLHYSVKVSLYSDLLIFPMIVILFLTGTFMVHQHHLSLNTPWIVVAYCALSVVSVLWFFQLLIKYYNFISKKSTYFHYQKSYIVLNILIILIFCIFVHDAVTQQTWLWK